MILLVVFVILKDGRVASEVAGLADRELRTGRALETDSQNRLLIAHFASSNGTFDPRGSGIRTPCLLSP